MTIIAYSNGVMAADSATTSDGIYIGDSVKIVRAQDGALAAASGSGGYTERFRAWFFLPGKRHNAPSAEEGEFHALIVEADGRCYEVHHSGLLVPIDAHFCATGSAWKFAYGAMAAGASAERAVELCIQHCVGIRGPVQVEHLAPNRARGPSEMSREGGE